MLGTYIEELIKLNYSFHSSSTFSPWRQMDGRPHFLYFVDYQDLWAEALRSRVLSSRCGLCARAIGPTEKEDESCAVLLSSACECGTQSKCRVADRFNGGTKLQKEFEQEKPALEDGGFQQGFRSVEVELAGSQSPATGSNSLEDLRHNEASDSFDGSTEGASAARFESRKTGEGCKGIRGRRSDFQDIRRTNRGEYRYGDDGSKIIRGEELDVTCKNSPSDLKTPAAEGCELSRNIAAVLGTTGPGILAVRNVLQVAELRKRLLPLAKKLALMPDQLRRPILKEHDLNTDVPLKRPDRPVSAFSTQLRYRHDVRPRYEPCDPSPVPKGPECLGNMAREPTGRQKDLTGRSGPQTIIESDRDEADLGRCLKQLGSIMVEVGLLVARLCDDVVPGAELEDAILESGTAKGRLIHYHSQLESQFLSSIVSNGSSKNVPNKVAKAIQALSNNCKRSDIEEPGSRIPLGSKKENEQSESWQQWHFDYGLFTLLTPPLYLKWESSGQDKGKDPVTDCVETSSWNHAGGHHSGLIIMYKGVAQYVNIPSDCLIVQVGEAAQILSGGSLAATAHCVCRPPQQEVSREMFVVFLQPAWDKCLKPPAGSDMEKVVDPRNEGYILRDTYHTTTSSLENSSCHRPMYSQGRVFHTQEVIVSCGPEEEGQRTKQQQQLMHTVPPLASRWSEGCTFAEFSRRTTRQYYGAHGLKSR